MKLNPVFLFTTFCIFLGGAYFILSKGKEGFTGIPTDNGGIQVATPPYASANLSQPNTVRLDEVLKEAYYDNSADNPFGNILLTEIQDHPTRKPAPPSFNVDTSQHITRMIKKSVQQIHPDIRNTNKELYGDLWDEFELDQANRPFYTTAITTIPNDQASFSTYLYGNMPSCRDVSNGQFACVQDNLRYLLI